MLEKKNNKTDENPKININSKIDNLESNVIENKDASFDQLLSVQLLIQKHSGLKELCKFFN